MEDHRLRERIALQEQLEQKDLPFLHAVLPFEWSSVTALGRNNYLCLRRMHLAERDQHLFEDPAKHAQLRRIVDWSLSTRDGTRQSLAFTPDGEVWEEVQAEHGNCLQRACKHYDHCHWQRARRRMQTAQVLVVNHALYFADLALRMAGASYLPAHRIVIFDEAHHLERTATESLGLRVGPRTVGWHLRRLHARRSEKSLLSRHGTPTARILWEEAHHHNEAFFAQLQERLETADSGEGLALQSDGKLVLVGLVETATPPATRTQFRVLRLNANGSLDTGFGTQGRVDTAISDQGDVANAVALQSGGFIVVAGTSSIQTNPNFAVARYDTNGALDTSFDEDGRMTVDFFGFADLGESVAVQPDGRIVVGGLARDNVDGYGVARIVP